MEHRDGVEVLQVESGAAESLREKVSQETETEAADSQLPLPQALQDLLRRLGGNLSPGEEPVHYLPELEDKKYGDFFRPGGRESRRRTEVRLMVLEALGTCNSLKNFSTSWMATWQLSVKEWEAFLIHFQATAQLEDMQIKSLLESAEEEALIGPQFQKLINRSLNLQELNLGGKPGIRAKLVAEIASGLRPKQHHRLRYIYFDGEGVEGSVMLSVAEIISCAPYLEYLHLDNVPRLNGDAKEALSRALKGPAHLKNFHVQSIEEELIHVLVEAYSVTCSYPVLEHLVLVDSSEGITAQGLVSLIGGNITSISIVNYADFLNHADFFHFSLDEWKNIGRSLLHRPTLLEFQISIRNNEWLEQEMEAMENGLTEMWEASQKNSLLLVHLLLTILDSSSSHPELVFLERAVSCTGTSTWLKKLTIRYVDVGTQNFTSFVDKLGSNSSVESLEINEGKSSSKDGWKNLFSNLRRNTSIRDLDLCDSDDLNDDNFRDMMDLLQVNFFLERIDVRGTKWARDGKSALINEALRRNTKQADYILIFEDVELTFHRAKAGRVFLCGEPFAGKTRLKATMMKIMSRESNSKSFPRRLIEGVKSRFGRTRGIEVEFLYEDNFVTISIWDLAGQEVFRALQSILFPRISHACLFVFAFSPFQGHGTSGKFKHDVQKAFRDELMSWLRFIVSNTQITGHIRPQVLVIITHKDCHKGPVELVIEEFERTVKGLREKFRDVVAIELCPQADVGTDKDPLFLRHVDATIVEDVQPILDVVRHRMTELLRTKAPRVPRACSDLASRLMKLPDVVKDSPIWTCAEFYEFCSNHEELSRFEHTDDEGRRVLHAVASNMHDVGAICMTPGALLQADDASKQESTEKLIVVQPNWLSQNLLGELIHSKLRDEKHQSKRRAWTSLKKTRASTTLSSDSLESTLSDGFVDLQRLSTLIQNVQKKMKMKVDERTVKKLLIEMELCHEFDYDGVTRYFMPKAFLGEKASASGRRTIDRLKWSEELAGSGEASEYFGFRVQCHDQERTSFSAAFYPRYQIHLRKQMEGLGVLNSNFIVSRYHVEIRVNGLLIFVEIDESAQNHIDVMVEFSDHASRDWAMGYVYKHVIKSLIEFCASDKGCPGVQLVVALLRTKCVKLLTPRVFREKQAVLIQDLKRLFQADVEDRARSGNVSDEFLSGYKHTWPSIISDNKDFSLQSEGEQAKTLLSSEDVRDVLMVVKKNHDDLAKDLRELIKVSSRLHDAANDDAANDVPPLIGKSSSAASLEAKYDSGSPVGNKEILQEVLHRQEQMGGDIQCLQAGMMKGFQEVKDELKNFKPNLDNMHALMADMTSKVDTIIGFMKSKENHKHPRRPYFASKKDVSKKHQLKAVVIHAEAVRLHFMCEARHRPHFVENQEGLELCLDKDGKFSKSIRMFSKLSLKMIWFLLKVGAQVTAGLGSVVTEISDLTTGVSVGVSAATANIVLEKLKPQLNENVPLDHRYAEECWCYLRDYLAPKLTDDNCAKWFKLHIVRYRNSNDPFAWLCESCVADGRKKFLLES